jgi:hypothetical protein
MSAHEGIHTRQETKDGKHAYPRGDGTWRQPTSVDTRSLDVVDA